jgi:hypothetical protein
MLTRADLKVFSNFPSSPSKWPNWESDVECLVIWVEDGRDNGVYSTPEALDVS